MQNLKLVTTPFDAKKYLSEVWQHIPQNGWVSPHYFSGMPKLASAPVTLADHEAAVAEARAQVDSRIEYGPDASCDVESTFELRDDDGEVYFQTVDTLEVRSWAMDVELDCLVWEYVAQQMLDFMYPDEAKECKARAAKYLASKAKKKKKAA
jgi:hypothetical protein